MLTVVPAQRGDVPVIAGLLEELDHFYGAAHIEPAEHRIPLIADLLFGATPAAFVLLARRADEAIGLASYSFLWPAAGVTKSLYLKELFVRQSLHRSGVGRRLMAEIYATAQKAGCSRVEWTTESTNDVAQQFYAALGAQCRPEKIFYRVEVQPLDPPSP
jgi:GNAT superfamily N-acetyltransferase